jgi:hypothetical protein
MSAEKATEAQIIEAIRQTGGVQGAARLLGVDTRGLFRRVARMKERGYNPDADQLHPVPETQSLKGVSTLYDDQGNVKMQWVKSEGKGTNPLAGMREVVEEMLVPLKGVAAAVKAPKAGLEHSLSSYIIGDAHFGMYSWGQETGADFDTDTASADLRAAIDHLVDTAPDSDTGMLVDVGDALHADNRSNVTPASGNLLDVDTRYQRVIRIAVEAFRYGILRLLQKHKNVRVIIAQGNHNPDSAGWMALCLSMYFENEPRVTVDTTPSKFHYFEWGVNLIGVTHGDKIKMADLPSIMATDKAEAWGRCKHRYWWTGHIHHTKHLEHRGCFTESFNTLASSDAWHHASGYRSVRQMQRIDVDKAHGIYSRAIFNLGMLR